VEPSEIEALRADLRSDDPSARAAAATRVLERFGSQAIAVLREAVVSENPEVRAKAAETLDMLAASGAPEFELIAESVREMSGR
jgi:hypothetical protein